MKLNPDCIRDVLLWLEENQEMEQGFDGLLTGNVAEYMSTDMPQYIKNHSADDVLYSIKQMMGLIGIGYEILLRGGMNFLEIFVLLKTGKKQNLLPQKLGP